MMSLKANAIRADSDFADADLDGDFLHPIRQTETVSMNETDCMTYSQALV